MLPKFTKDKNAPSSTIADMEIMSDKWFNGKASFASRRGTHAMKSSITFRPRKSSVCSDRPVINLATHSTYPLHQSLAIAIAGKTLDMLLQ